MTPERWPDPGGATPPPCPGSARLGVSPIGAACVSWGCFPAAPRGRGASQRAGSRVAGSPRGELCNGVLPAAVLPGPAEPAPRKGEMSRRPGGPRRRLGRVAGAGGGGGAGGLPSREAQGAGQRPRAAAGGGKARAGGKGRICSAEETQMAAARRHSGPGAGSQQPCPHRGPPAAAKYPDAPPERQTRSWEKGGRRGGGRA